MKTAKTLNWIIAVGGLWELIAPFVLGYSKTSGFLWDAVIVGIVLIILGVWAALAGALGTLKTLSWINAVLGLWLIIAPFIIGYSKLATPMWNDIIVGIIILVLGAWAALTAKE